MGDFHEAIRRQDAQTARAASDASRRHQQIARALPVIQQGLRELAQHLTAQRAQAFTYRHIKTRREWLGNSYYPPSPSGYVLHATAFSNSSYRSRENPHRKGAQLSHLNLLLPDGRVWAHKTWTGVEQGFVDLTRFETTDGLSGFKFHGWSVDGRRSFALDDNGNPVLCDSDWGEEPFHDYLAQKARNAEQFSWLWRGP